MAAASSKQVLAGLHAVVTGGSRGIGLATAKELAAHGVTLSLIARDQERLQTAASQITKEFGVKVGTAVADVSNAAEIEQAFAKIQKAHGPINILVNNAGMAESAPLTKTDKDLWNRTIATDLTSVYLCSRAVIDEMIGHKQGRIINIASTAGLNGLPYISAYCAAKHGVIGFTRSLALELLAFGITVNAICPNFTETDLLKNSIEKVAQKTGRPEAEIRQSYLKNMPQGRFVDPGEIARRVAWLCLPAQSKVTGQAIEISGGEVNS